VHHDRTLDRKPFSRLTEGPQVNETLWSDAPYVKDDSAGPTLKSDVGSPPGSHSEIKVGTRLRWTGCDCPSYDKGGIYSVVEVHPAMWVVEGDMQRNYESSMSCWEIVDEPKQEKPKKVPVRRGGIVEFPSADLQVWGRDGKIETYTIDGRVNADMPDVFGKALRSTDMTSIRVKSSFPGPLPSWCEWEKGSEPQRSAETLVVKECETCLYQDDESHSKHCAPCNKPTVAGWQPKRPDGYKGCENCASKRYNDALGGTLCCKSHRPGPGIGRHAGWQYENMPKEPCPDWVPEPPF